MLSRTGLGRALAASVLLASSTALAVTPNAGPRAALDSEWAVTAAAGVSTPLRITPDFQWDRPARAIAWHRFTAAFAGTWFASWDRATGVPSRIFGEGIAVPGASADPAIAAQFARAFLAAHLDLLAPGSRVTDLELVANVSDGDIRTLGFVQRANGLRVVGGQVAFEFKRDRLFVIHSEALPDVRVPTYAPLLAVPLAARAREATIAELGLAHATAGAPGSPVVLPLIGDDGVLGYRVTIPVVIDAGVDGRWTVYADATTGAPVARHQDLRFSEGTVVYDAVVRWSGRPRTTYPASRMHAQVNGAGATSSQTGAVSWGGTAPAALVATTDGDLVKVINKEATNQTLSTSIAPGGAVTWSLAADPNLDAELNVFVHTQIAKEYVRTFAPNLAFLDDQIEANVDLPQACNAYYDGSSINFFAAGMGSDGNPCGNTGTISDVVYHEFEHGVHDHSIIPGVGAFEGALSEGQSDFLAASITGDPGMGRGFFANDEPLRDLDPPDKEWRWPEDIGEIHHQGMIFAGAMWDLRKALIADLTEPVAVPIVNHLFYAAIQRAPNIPATMIEVLAADDDNGNLADGTPHECTILTAFGAHGLRPWTATTAQPGAMVAADGETTTPIDVTLTGLSTRCTSDAISSIVLAWSPRSGPGTSGTVAMTPGADALHYGAPLPLPADGDLVSYQIRIKFADGSDVNLPDNRVDPYYVLYQGETVPLLCTDFEADPFAAGWTQVAVKNKDDWAWGTPIAANSGDPGAAASGTHVVGTKLDGDGRYSPSSVMQLVSPEIDLGKYSDVHLQYKRWLTIQDGANDTATIYANGEQAWQNLTNKFDDPAGHQDHHIDKEWRFDDVPLSGHIVNGNKLRVTFELDSNSGYQLGGWNLDDVCIVANAHAFCGDGIKQGTEQCDNADANADVADVCRTYCRLPACGDGILDTSEACDDGNKADGDDCTPSCTIPPPKPEDGCCQAGPAPDAGTIGGWLFVAGLLLRRRKTRDRARAS